MRAHYFQHVPFEGLGSIEPWLTNAGYSISSTAFFGSGELPNLEDIDLLIIMGGPMSVNDEAEYPWLIKEKAFIKQAIAAGKSVLGICLGAQLIADAMGAAVYAGEHKEIGWFPIEASSANNPSVVQLPKQLNVFHWHGETFDLPKRAIRLASSAGCANQAFQIGRHVIGLQCHLETTPLSAKAIVEHCRDELVEGRFIQSASELLAADEERYRGINRWMERILEYLHANHAKAANS
ncbi:hypothetical protein L0B52_03145 [Suttonella sp. R2A3]|uniref:type 1 glutamine amidotransferase n=1 Tax=Suttonella sp. R2A3 TaxID=2908648 RepID=UPI001F43E2AC|nr:hypothetical protein [Suttonella sp. R2A3]UJF25158.1 hypothetical protein L0B52_03145 [Suttonella sp. R2A3]